ncbi:MAG: HAMP domain-containing sensor histidine kinase [Alphaproteobacteria bacterium]|nr:HAMP domain-containing sensor histidine kinase [Alphaproteobacteria bacterium]
MKSLSARLLLLTVIFVMLAEVLIFAPSVARFRETYLADRLQAAHLAVLVLEVAPDGMVSEEMTSELLNFVGAYSVAAKRGDSKLSLMQKMPPLIDATLVPAQESPWTMIDQALLALVQDKEQVVRVIGPSPRNSAVEIEIVFSDAALRAEIRAFAVRIFFLSLAISVSTAFMVFLVLRRQLVRPLKRITRNMIRFRSHPEDQSLVMRPSKRLDEIGVAERELASMQTTIRDALTQRKHLAALGTAVAKINHDLRGILSSALVVSDRLETSDDPEVRRIAPGILDAIDRAVALCTRTLNYVGHDTPDLVLSDVKIAGVVAEAGFGLPNGAVLVNDVEETLSVHGDRAQLFRIINNLLRNAAEAGATQIAVSARSVADLVEITLQDDGPGLPPRALENIFLPFEGSGKAGGTGLGLSIARELARSHGGDLFLRKTGSTGTVFILTLPERARNEDS